MDSKVKIATPVIFVLVMMMASVLALFSSTSTQAAAPNLSTKQPAQIVGVNQEPPIVRPEITLSASIAPEPVVGKVVTLRLEVTSALDEPDSSITLRMPDEIELVEGDLIWNGSINSNKPLVHELSIVVREAGNWVIDVSATASSAVHDSERLHLVSTDKSGQVILSAEYRVVQPLDKWPGDPSVIIPYEIPRTPLRIETIDELMPQAAGQVTIQGNITFGFKSQDCNSATCISTGTMPLRNAPAPARSSTSTKPCQLRPGVPPRRLHCWPATAVFNTATDYSSSSFNKKNGTEIGLRLRWSGTSAPSGSNSSGSPALR